MLFSCQNLISGNIFNKFNLKIFNLGFFNNFFSPIPKNFIFMEWLNVDSSNELFHESIVLGLLERKIFTIKGNLS
jgi:hypothetical protein